MSTVEHLVVEIRGKSLPFKDAVGSDPYFKLINPQLLKKNKKKSDKFHIIYESEAIQNCHEPQWLAIDFYSDKVDFEQELILQVWDNTNFYYPVYIGESTFKISDFRDQFVNKKIGLETTPDGLTGYVKATTRPSHPYQGKPYLKLRRSLQTGHGSKTTNAPCFEEHDSNKFTHSEKTSKYWERTNARRAKEEELFLAKLREQFDHFDIDGNGTIDEYEMYTIIPSVWGGRQVTEEEVLEIIVEVDADFNGVVDFEEFRQCVKVLDRRYAERIAKEKKEDRNRRLQEREKTEWERNNEAQKAAMIIEQDLYVKNMEEKAMKKQEEKRAERAARGDDEEESTIVEEMIDDAASSVYDDAVPELKVDENMEMGNVLDQVENFEENFEENEVRPDMSGGLMDWVNEAKEQEESGTVESRSEVGLSEAERLEAEIEAQAAESVLSEPVL